MAQDASKQGKLDSFATIFLFIFLPCMWGLGLKKSTTPASVAATPPCSPTPFQRQLDVRHSWQFKGGRCDGAF